MTTIVTMKTKNIIENKPPQVLTPGLLAAVDFQGLAGGRPWHSWRPCTSTSSPGWQGPSCSRLAPGEVYSENNVEYEKGNENEDERMKMMRMRSTCRNSALGWASGPATQGQSCRANSWQERGRWRAPATREGSIGETRLIRMWGREIRMSRAASTLLKNC